MSKTIPEGTTHTTRSDGAYYKKENNIWYIYVHNAFEANWIKSVKDEEWLNKHLIELKHPYWYINKQLPPVGTECRFILGNEDLINTKNEITRLGIIKAHVADGKTAIIDFGTSWTSSPNPNRFIPKQSFKEQRINEIKEVFFNTDMTHVTKLVGTDKDYIINDDIISEICEIIYEKFLTTSELINKD